MKALSPISKILHVLLIYKNAIYRKYIHYRNDHFVVIIVHRSMHSIIRPQMELNLVVDICPIHQPLLFIGSSNELVSGVVDFSVGG